MKIILIVALSLMAHVAWADVYLVHFDSSLGQAGGSGWVDTTANTFDFVFGPYTDTLYTGRYEWSSSGAPCVAGYPCYDFGLNLDPASVHFLDGETNAVWPTAELDPRFGPSIWSFDGEWGIYLNRGNTGIYVDWGTFSTSAVPEPGALLLLGTCVGCLTIRLRRRSRGVRSA